MRSRAVATTALFAAVALVGVLASQAQAAPALPLPLPPAGAESLVTEGVTIEGPLVNNLNLPMTK
ncbi:hypothetical protein [Streptomyces flaveus]|uniref:Secreted protein n=1 Tax=Streptomyces flaveus TaxID=66370 RepID=A0A917QX31_9ACTN|nr:hypothetical protein [Streptomyces flaveus]GGK73282.1 hypothetical protein GCM10010094_37930 [Streptomyces flaveus]